jgi:uncharacterized repeat protein (TIGR02543 family)
MMKKTLVLALAALLVLVCSNPSGGGDGGSVSHTVTFEANGGIPAPADQTVEKGGTVTEPPAMTKADFAFVGWYKEAGLTSPWVFATDTVTEDITLYAKWVDDSHWGVAWELNGGAWAGGTTPESEVIKDGTITKPEDPEKTGCGDITLYAKWDINAYTVTFNVNGGDSLGEGLDTRTVDHGVEIGALPEPTRTNYSFAGWFTEAEGGTQYSDPSATVTETFTLYAHWTINTYTVTFNVNGGNSLGAGGTRTVSHGAAIEALPEPTRTNYGFDGWFTEAEDGAQYSDPSTTVTEAFTLYAHWNPITVWDGSSIANGFAGGGGSSVADPYIISAAAELAYLARQVNAGTNYAGKYFTLTGDLDLNGQEWTAIGTNARSFRGSFDGDGHVISGLVINKSGTHYQGLFGYLDGAKISNLGLEDVAITGQGGVGGIAGYVFNSSIENSYSTGTVSGDGNDVGGIAGTVNSGNIKNCYSTGTVSGSGTNSLDVGGIAGQIFNGSSIENCYSTGTVVSGTYYAGGIAGVVTNSSIKYCAALNPSVTALINFAGRVVGAISSGGTNTFTGNVAWDNMGTGSVAFRAGTDYNGTLKAKTVFHSATGFPFTVNAYPWTYTAGKLPILGGLAGQGNALPAHLN